MSDYSLRTCSESDFNFVFDLNKKNMQKYVDVLRGWNDDHERKDMRKQFRPGLDQIVVADGRNIGFLSVIAHADCIQLRHIEIDPEYQNRGIGSEIIQHVVDTGRKAGVPVTLAVLAVNPAMRLYERLGFVAVETIDQGEKGLKSVMKAVP
jgi:GNAT superfamily N-acetyltransferase